METDLNTYLNGSALNQIIYGNLTNSTFDFSLPPIEIQGMDVLLTFCIIWTVIFLFMLYYQMRQSWGGA